MTTNFDEEGYSVVRKTVYGFDKGVFGQTRVLSVPNDGQFHLLSSVVLQFDLPGLTATSDDQDVRYTPQIGNVMIENIALLIGDQKISEQPGLFMTLYSDVMKDKLYGDVDFLNRQTQHLTSFAPRIKGSTIFVPLTFWFCEDVRNALPLFMLREEVKLQIKFRPFSEIWQSRRYVGGGEGLANKIKRTVPGTAPVPDTESFRIIAHLDFVVLSDGNEAWFRKRNPFLIQTTETRVAPVDSLPITTLSLEEFTNPTSKIFWYLQKERQIQDNDWFNFSSRSSYDDIVSPVTLVDPSVVSPGPPQSIEVSDRVIDTPSISMRVTVGPKTVKNTTYGTGQVTCLYVGGREAPELHLPRSKDGITVPYVFEDASGLLRIYDDPAFTAPHANFDVDSKVLTVTASTPQQLYYTQLRPEGVPDVTGGGVIHTTVQFPDAAVAPTEEAMLIDDALIARTSSNFTWPYGPHQITVFESAGVREVQTPDLDIMSYDSVPEWLRLYVQNNPQLDAAAFAHWDSVDAVVTLGMDRGGDLALRDAGGPLFVDDGRFQGYALGVAYLFRKTEVVRLDLKHYFKNTDGAFFQTFAESVTRRAATIEVRFEVVNNSVMTGIREFDDALMVMQETNPTGFAAAFLAMSGTEYSNVIYTAHLNNEDTFAVEPAWSPFNASYATATLRVGGTVDPWTQSVVINEVYFELPTTFPQGSTPLFSTNDIDVTSFTIDFDSKLKNVRRPGYNLGSEVPLQVNNFQGGDPTSYMGTYVVKAINGTTAVAQLDSTKDTFNNPPSQVSFDAVGTWSEDQMVTLTFRSTTPEKKPLVCVSAPPRTFAEEFPDWPATEWDRVDAAVYFRGPEGVQHPGSYMLLTNGSKALRARANITNGALSWTFDDVPTPNLRLQPAPVGEIWVRHPVVINVMLTTELNMGVVSSLTGNPGRLTAENIYQESVGGIAEAVASRMAIFVLQDDSWVMQAPLQLVRGFAYQFVPVDYENEKLFTELQQESGGGGFFRTTREVDAGSYTVRMADQQTLNSIAQTLIESATDPENYPVDIDGVFQTYPSNLAYATITVTNVVQEGQTYRCTYTGQITHTELSTDGLSVVTKPTQHTVGFLRTKTKDTRWGDVEDFEVTGRHPFWTGRGIPSGLHMYVSQNYKTVYGAAKTLYVFPETPNGQQYLDDTIDIVNGEVKYRGNTYEVQWSEDDDGVVEVPEDGTGFKVSVETGRFSAVFVWGPANNFVEPFQSFSNPKEDVGATAFQASSNNIRSGVDMHLHVTDPDVTTLWYDVDPKSLTTSPFGSYATVRDAGGVGKEFDLEDCFVDTKGGEGVRVVLDKGRTAVTGVKADSENAHYLVAPFTGSDGFSVPAVEVAYPAQVDGQYAVNDYVVAAADTQNGNLRHRIRRVEQRRVTYELPGQVVHVPSDFLRDVGSDDPDWVQTVVDEVPPETGSLRIGTVVRMGHTYMIRQDPGSAVLQASGVDYRLNSGESATAQQVMDQGGWSVWTATPDNVPSTWTMGQNSNKFWLGSNPLHAGYDIRGRVYQANVDPMAEHAFVSRRLDSAVVLPNFFEGRQRAMLLRGIYAVTLDYLSVSSESGVWVGNSSAAQQISAVLPLVQASEQSLGLPKRIRATAYGFDQSYAVAQIAPGTEENKVWTDTTTTTSDRVVMLAQDRADGATDLQNKLRHLTYRVAASTRNWRALEDALNRNVQVMEYNHTWSTQLFESTNRYLFQAVQDIWQEVAELGARMKDAERRRDPLPHEFNPDRDKWYVQNPDDLHLMTRARLVKAPDNEIVPWQDYKLFYYLMNYKDGSYLEHQVYSYVFTSRSFGGGGGGSAKRDAEDFKTAKLSLSVEVNQKQVDLGANRCRLFVFLQCFQNLQITPDGGVTKACEYDAVSGQWKCSSDMNSRAVRSTNEPSMLMAVKDSATIHTKERQQQQQRPPFRSQHDGGRLQEAVVFHREQKQGVGSHDFVGLVNSRQESLTTAQRQQNEFMRRYRAENHNKLQDIFGTRHRTQQ